MRLRIAVLFGCMVGMCAGLQAQEEPIKLTNPSFEDLPHHSKPPRGWIDCGFDGETPVDVQPNGTFSVTKPADEGNTYIGMVVRDNDTWEAVSQRLSRPLQAGQCYEFTVSLSRSELYVSTSRVTDSPANYVTPAKLRIYGGNDYCDKGFLLAETSLIINTRWLEYSFRFEPTGNYTHLIFEAFYKTPSLFPYNGNVLMDNASEIVPVPCDEEIIAQEEPEEPQEQVREVVVEEANPDPVNERVDPPAQRDPDPITIEEDPPEDSPPPLQPRPTDEATSQNEVIEDVLFSELTEADIREGMTLRTNQIFFKADKSLITDQSFDVLNEIYQFLSSNDGVVIEVGGHTNDLPPHKYCDELSDARAKAVTEYLARKGIDRDRLKYKGYGKRQPIATNDTPAGRRKNQRVEFKILQVSGD